MLWLPSLQARDGFLTAAMEAARLKKKFKTQQAVTDALGQVCACCCPVSFSLMFGAFCV